MGLYALYTMIELIKFCSHARAEVRHTGAHEPADERADRHADEPMSEPTMMQPRYSWHGFVQRACFVTLDWKWQIAR